MKKINVALLNSNYMKIGPYAKKGTEIFTYVLTNGMVKYKKKSINLTAFSSGNSQISIKKESIMFRASQNIPTIGEKHHLIFELALFSKAFSMQKKFDLFHINFGSGEFILPFAQFVKKPIVITMHGNTDEAHCQLFFSLYHNLKNIYFVPISNYQRKFLPSLNYMKTIYHGIDTKKYAFSPNGGKSMIWTGRAIPEKGVDTVLQVAKKLKKYTRIFPIIREEYLQWLHEEIIKKRDLITQIVKVYIDFNVTRSSLIAEYQTSKLFLFPLRWEEPFGLTLIESMACGTPVVAYARGSIPEIVKDGETGFIVNPSDDNIKGDFVIKKAGIEGLCEAVEKIYAMPEEQYKQMRQNCRNHVEKNFTIERMINQYEEVYNEAIIKYRK